MTLDPHHEGAASPPPPSAARGTVLVVDDDDALARALARMLRRLGFTVEIAGDGLQGAELVRTRSFDVVVSDIDMPGLDGVQLLRAVREHDLDLPVVLMTAAPAIETAIVAVQLGALDYLVKPVDTQALERLVERGARLRALARLKREAMQRLGSDSLTPADRAGREASFGRALDTLWLAHQPIVRANGSLFGYEALLRSDEASLPHPGAFVDAAERLDRVHDLGRAVRSRAAGSVALTGEPTALFVNLHPRDLADDDLLSGYAPLAAVAGRVVLEVTERAPLDDVPNVRARIASLRRLGFRVALDDLGAGYAGLHTFAQLEPDIVKLDMALVRDIDRSPTQQKLVRSMTSLCHEMGSLVVGEGVETRAELDTLLDLGCDLLQGFLLAKPGRGFPTYDW